METTGESGHDAPRRQFLRGTALLAGGVAALLSGCTVERTGTPGGAVAGATSKLATVLQRKKVLVGTGTGNPPWHFSDQSGTVAGFDIEMGRLVARALFNDAQAVDFVQQSPDARIPNLLTNKVDVCFQFMTVNAKRAQQVAFTIPYYREGIGLLLSAGGHYGDFKALQAAGTQARVSILMNADAEQSVHEALPKAQVVSLDTQANVIQAMESGRVDAAAVDQSTVRWLQTQDPRRYRDAGFGWHAQTYGAAVRPDDQVWLNFLNTVLHEAMTGQDFPIYKAAFHRYFGVDLPAPTIGFPLEYAAARGA